jgi:hypothetical protein
MHYQEIFFTILICGAGFYLTHLIAKYIGAKRIIGYKNTVLWCLMLSPFLGLIIALISPWQKSAE